MSKPILDDAEYAEFLRALANKDTKAFRNADNRLQGLISQLSPDDHFHLLSRIISANFNAVRLYVDKSKDIFDIRMTRKNLLNGSASYSPGKIKTSLSQNSILSPIFISIADAYDTAKYEILKLGFWEGHRTEPHTSPFALYSLAYNYDLKLKKFNALKKQARKAMLRIADMAAALNFIDYAQDVRDEMAARLLRFNRFLKDVFSMPVGEEKHIINAFETVTGCSFAQDYRLERNAKLSQLANRKKRCSYIVDAAASNGGNFFFYLGVPPFTFKNKKKAINCALDLANLEGQNFHSNLEKAFVIKIDGDNSEEIATFTPDVFADSILQ